jgi:hypothetical protein
MFSLLDLEQHIIEGGKPSMAVEEKDMSYDTAELRVVWSPEENRKNFKALSQQWHRDTDGASSVHEKITHDAYLKIIGMGRTAVPFILEEMKHGSVHWFVALRAIIGHDPFPASCTNMRMALQAWLDWGKAHKFID